MGKKNTLIKRRHSTAILRPTKMTDGEETFEQLGAEPKHFASKLFMDLLNKDYRYLFVFIGLSVVGLVVMFWLPFLVLILSYTCPMSNNGTAVCNPPLTEAYTAWDAFAVAFASPIVCCILCCCQISIFFFLGVSIVDISRKYCIFSQ